MNDIQIRMGKFSYRHIFGGLVRFQRPYEVSKWMDKVKEDSAQSSMRVWQPRLPKEEKRNGEDRDDEGGDNFRRSPSVDRTRGDGEHKQNEPRCMCRWLQSTLDKQWKEMHTPANTNTPTKSSLLNRSSFSARVSWTPPLRLIFGTKTIINKVMAPMTIAVK